MQLVYRSLAQMTSSKKDFHFNRKKGMVPPCRPASTHVPFQAPRSVSVRLANCLCFSAGGGANRRRHTQPTTSGQWSDSWVLASFVGFSSTGPRRLWDGPTSCAANLARARVQLIGTARVAVGVLVWKCTSPAAFRLSTVPGGSSKGLLILNAIYLKIDVDLCIADRSP